MCNWRKGSGKVNALRPLVPSSDQTTAVFRKRSIFMPHPSTHPPTRLPASFRSVFRYLKSSRHLLVASSVSFAVFNLQRMAIAQLHMSPYSKKRLADSAPCLALRSSIDFWAKSQAFARCRSGKRRRKQRRLMLCCTAYIL